MQQPTRRTKCAIIALSVVMATALNVASVAFAVGEEAELQGAWRGGGNVVLPSGDIERTACRARFTHRSGVDYVVNAVCSTPSIRLAQTASVRRTSEGTFTGKFFNEEYSISGEIRVTVRGNKLRVYLNGGGGSANFTLMR